MSDPSVYRRLAALEAMAQMRPDLAGGCSGARVYRTTNRTLTTATPTAIGFNAERYDTGGYHDNTTNNERLTAPADGYYLIGGHLLWTGNSTGRRIVEITVNGSTIVARQEIPQPGVATSTAQSIATEYYLTAGQYVELYARQDSGGDLDLVVAANYSIEFWIRRYAQ